jgi:hypothetical protein
MDTIHANALQVGGLRADFNGRDSKFLHDLKTEHQ